MAPTRPVSGAVIASSWGQPVHDYTFAPAGAIAHGGSSVPMLNAGAFRRLRLDTVDEDPGGYIDVPGDKAVVPTDGGGLYLVLVTGTTDNGDAADETNPRLQLNGVDVARDQVQQEGATAVVWNISWVGILAAVDELYVRCRQIGSNARADVVIDSFVMVRLGDEVGAPPPP